MSSKPKTKKPQRFSISADVDIELKKWFQTHCKETGRKMGWIISEYLRKYRAEVQAKSNGGGQ